MPCSYLPLLLLFLLPLSSSKTVENKVILKGNQTILSLKGVFQLGFFSTTNGQLSSSTSQSSSSGWYLGIWYASVPTPTYVWVANRNQPVSDPYSSSLELTSSGNLIITNSLDGVVWQTDNNKSPGTDFRFSEAGNLMLIKDDGSPVWQSFENPTDTWLPGMNVTGQTAMTSWRTQFDPSPGFYSLRLSRSFNEFELVYKGATRYWSTGNWTGDSFVGVPEMTVPYIYRFHFVNPYAPTASFWYIVAPSSDSSAEEPRLTRFLVDYNGQMKQYTWEPQTQSWNMFWLQPEDPCHVYNLCGPLGFCSNELLKPCACIRGFTPKNATAWRSEDYSDGCLRESGGSCDLRDTFENVGRLGYDGVVDISRSQISKSSCTKMCLGNCSCVGFYHNDKSDLCRILLGSPMNIKNSSSSTGTSIDGDVLYIRDSRRRNAKGSISKSMVILCSVVGAISILGFGLIVPFILMKRSRKRKKIRKENEDGFAVLNIKVFSFKELQTVTNGFSEKVGHGGFGAVFKGTLPDSSTFIAVKRLERPGSGESEFRAEVCTIGNIQHVNLVRLRGFCSQNLHRLLVYDYMPNGSLSSYLSRTSPKLLSWDVRFRIALGTAKGIAYLHEGCRDCIIHCDIKPENILLDSEYNAKVSDFGLAKLVGRDFSRVLATMRGTWGYVAPEWISGLPITTKADVYSFGMTLLELIGGRRNVIVNNETPEEKEEKVKETESEKWFFPPWAAREIIQGNVDSVVDPRLEGVYDIEEATRMAAVAVWCIQDNEEIRPGMGTVVKMLEGVVEVTVPPPPKLIQALVSGESYRGGDTGLSGTTCSEGRGCSDLNTGLSSAGSRSSFGRPSSP